MPSKKSKQSTYIILALIGLILFIVIPLTVTMVLGVVGIFSPQLLDDIYIRCFGAIVVLLTNILLYKLGICMYDMRY